MGISLWCSEHETRHLPSYENEICDPLKGAESVTTFLLWAWSDISCEDVTDQITLVCLWNESDNIAGISASQIHTASSEHEAMHRQCGENATETIGCVFSLYGPETNAYRLCVLDVNYCIYGSWENAPPGENVTARTSSLWTRDSPEILAPISCVHIPDTDFVVGWGTHYTFSIVQKYAHPKL